MLTILLLATLFAPAQAEIKPEALDWFRKGEAMIGTGQAYSDQQAECFRKAVELQSDFAAARYNLALTYLGQNAYDPALAQLDALQSLEPEQPRGYVLKAEIHLRTDHAPEAEKELEKALALAPEDAEAWRYLARAQFQQGRLEEALASQDRAASLKPDLEGLDFDQAVLRQRLGKLDEAAASYRRHLEKNPDDFEARTLLAGALIDLGDSAGALEQLLAAEKLEPNDTEIRKQIGFLYLERGDLEEAKRRLEGVDSPGALANLGLIARKQGQLDQAISYFLKALEKAPQDPELWINLADAYFSKRDESRALAGYEKAVGLGAADYETFFNLGALYANQDDNLKAAQWLDKALQLKPDSGDAHYSLGIVLERLSDPDKAFQHYLQAVANGNDSARLHFRLSVLYARQGDAGQALAHLEACLRQEADKYLPIIDKELLNVHSDFDSIRYTVRFSELLKKYRAEAHTGNSGL